MSLIKKVRAVESVFKSLEKEIHGFQKSTNLKCIPGCHHCCTNSKIEATPLEFLPLAFHLHKTHQADIFLEKLNEYNNQKVCLLFNPFNSVGACSFYPYRGLICRLFGFSAMIDKQDTKRIITCKLIKSQQQEGFLKAERLINSGLGVPLSGKYYMKLYAIDLKLSSNYYPINQAIQKALEMVLFHFSYTNRRVG
ncbi:MAG: YkgJ family cysteine cluster protein [Bacteroidetes bacterium]|nr:YkgJ family cysteine cluster protein [Bacteroidota bacterium]